MRFKRSFSEGYMAAFGLTSGAVLIYGGTRALLAGRLVWNDKFGRVYESHWAIPALMIGLGCALLYLVIRNGFRLP